ncbi:hypothetical protein [Paraburkholderia acidisoli]|uniref:Uncharacterized protein n=1 Tax=Paraburkholderia acidisoli TaxID=2571748 RepID=A0A7Z2GK64_9BURK|nr:hypothetical protein [Paraburkholderia acidisoli]QGZ63271.1 hypothetical protein FAZ98_15820 [Paraburkholderia acidisoli]
MPVPRPVPSGDFLSTKAIIRRAKRPLGKGKREIDAGSDRVCLLEIDVDGRRQSAARCRAAIFPDVCKKHLGGVGEAVRRCLPQTPIPLQNNAL